MASKRRSPSRRALSEEERAEKRAAERKLMAEAVEQLRSSEGWQCWWLQVRRHLHTYSFHNQLLIAYQRPWSTRVAGFRRWLSLGYAVRKGERGVSLTATWDSVHHPRGQPHSHSVARRIRLRSP